MDLGVLFDTKITGGVYTRRSLDYNVIVLEDTIKYQGGIAIFFHNLPPH